LFTAFLGAAIVAAHPDGPRDDPNRARTTRWFARNWQRSTRRAYLVPWGLREELRSPLAA
jgi:hypothetical protein